MIKYCVCGLGYDENNCITDYEMYLGDFDNYEEAYEFSSNFRAEIQNGSSEMRPMFIRYFFSWKSAKMTAMKSAVLM